MSARLIGAHMPTSKGLPKAILNGAAIGCTCVQVFTSSPQRWKGKTYTEADGLALAEAIENSQVESVVSHDSYLINLSAMDEELREKSVAGIVREIERCHTLGIPAAVSHLGAHMGRGEKEGIALVAEGLRKAFDQTPDDVTILSETTAGQGTALFHQFEHQAELLEALDGTARLGICLDTCHLFAAGYDLSTDEGYDETMDRLGGLIGFERVRCVHVNDSKHPHGSRKDRHEHLGEGEIGPTPFVRLVNDSRFESIPIVIETPKADEFHEKNVAKLWDWRRGSDDG